MHLQDEPYFKKREVFPFVKPLSFSRKYSFLGVASLGETMLPSLASVFRCFKPLKGQWLPPIYEVKHEASMNLFLGKIWHLKVHYENHIIYFIYVRVQRFFWGGSTFLEPYYICILYKYIDVWKITYQPEFTPLSVFLFLQKGHSLWLARWEFSVKRFGFLFHLLFWIFTVRFVVGFFGERNIACHVMRWMKQWKNFNQNQEPWG